MAKLLGDADEMNKLMKAIEAVKSIPCGMVHEWKIKWEPDVWRAHRSRQHNKTYYRHAKTHQSLWHKPDRPSDRGAYFFVHLGSGCTQWFPPVDNHLGYYVRGVKMYDPCNPGL